MTGDLYTVLDLLAPHVEEPGYSGYFRKEFDAEPTVFTFRDGTFGPLKGSVMNQVWISSKESPDGYDN
jgi:hypothetical protein